MEIKNNFIVIVKLVNQYHVADLGVSDNVISGIE